ncbi:hypothetical protein BI334_20595 [Moorena producens 3L]|nr:hypothetical protein BI334_20595 [Moorena producens 3L]
MLIFLGTKNLLDPLVTFASSGATRGELNYGSSAPGGFPKPIYWANYCASKLHCCIAFSSNASRGLK